MGDTQGRSSVLTWISDDRSDHTEAAAVDTPQKMISGGCHRHDLDKDGPSLVSV